MPARNFVQKGFYFTSSLAKYYGPFYGREKFCCKTVGIYAMPCEWAVIERPSIRDGMQSSGNVRNNSLVDLEIRCSIRLSYGRIFQQLVTLQ